MEKLQTYFVLGALGFASLILAAEPVVWLVRSWRDPAYQSDGVWFVLALIGAVLVSIRSGPARAVRSGEGLLGLFVLAALVRFAGQVFAVNILSALALAVDVFALARWARVDLRPFALSPFWLCVFFLFALPLAPILERVLGFPLQIVSAEISCLLLSPVFGDLICEGTRLRVSGVDVMVDLPCAGASGLLLMLALWTAINARFRPRFGPALGGLVLVLALALLGNGFRIALLAAGLALGIDTTAGALHVGIGLCALALQAAPVVLWYRPKPRGARLARNGRLPRWAGVPLAALSLVAALAIVTAPKDPPDRSGAVAQINLPAQLLGAPRQDAALSAIETHYFEAYGGRAQKAHYGAMGLNIVQTGAPLRHLHSPATCLRGMGYEVTFLGTSFEPIPTASYRAIGPDGAVWLVSVSFVSSAGHRTPSVGEAVWAWLQGGTGSWTSIQRITPISLSPEARAALEQAALAALDI